MTPAVNPVTPHGQQPPPTSYAIATATANATAPEPPAIGANARGNDDDDDDREDFDEERFTLVREISCVKGSSSSMFKELDIKRASQELDINR